MKHQYYDRSPLKYYNMTPQPIRIYNPKCSVDCLLMPSGKTIQPRNYMETADHRMNYRNYRRLLGWDEDGLGVVTTHVSDKGLSHHSIDQGRGIYLYQRKQQSCVQFTLVDNAAMGCDWWELPARSHNTLWIVTPECFEAIPNDRDDFATPVLPTYDDNNNIMGYRGLQVKG